MFYHKVKVHLMLSQEFTQFFLILIVMHKLLASNKLEWDTTCSVIIVHGLFQVQQFQSSLWCHLSPYKSILLGTHTDLLGLSAMGCCTGESGSPLWLAGCFVVSGLRCYHVWQYVPPSSDLCWRYFTYLAFLQIFSGGLYMTVCPISWFSSALCWFFVDLNKTFCSQGSICHR